jgi:CheY-like chemotaxis protein
VLVVDDEVAFARSLRLLLGEQHDVVVESDGRSALATLTTGERFDIVLCDLMMAGMSGMDLHDALASEHPNVVPRIVFLTGGATNDRARAFLARSDVRHLEKPVELPVLEGTIRAVVQDSAPS